MVVSVNEGTAFAYETKLLKGDGTPVLLSELSTLTLTLYNKISEAIINSRNAVSVKNANGGTFHATSGQFTMLFDTADSPYLSAAPNPTPLIERHVALFEATWANGGAHNWEVEIDVRNLSFV